MQDKAADHHLGRLLFREWGIRDDRAALAALPGPKVLRYGSRDCEPDCRMYDFVGGAAIARHIRAHADELRAVGSERADRGRRTGPHRRPGHDGCDRPSVVRRA